MKLLKSLLLISILSANFVTNAQFTDQINSNRPGNSNGAFSVGKTIFQIESGINYISESNNNLNYDISGFGLDFTGRYGFWREQLEVSLDVQFQMDKYKTDILQINRSGLRQTTLGLKYLIYDPFKKGEEKPNIYSWKANQKFKWKQLIPAISLYAGLNYNMKNDFSIQGESSFSPKIVLITQNHFGRKWVFVTNIIADKISSETFNYGGIATVTHGINEKWSVFGELRLIKNDPYNDPIISLGATHLIKNNLQIDASINKSIENNPSHLYGGIGFSWRFDKKHKDPQIKEGKEVKEDKKLKKEKSKAGVLSEDELQKEAEKAERKRKKNKDLELEELEKPAEEKKKRLDDFEDGKEE